MKKNDELPEDEKFSDDPEENLRMQNDFLKLKMMAESGALFGGEGDLPPDIENQFLKNIMEFEKAYATSQPQTIFETLGKPHFEDEKNLKGEEFKTAYRRLEGLLKKHGIRMNFVAKRSNRFKYKFITTELFQHTTEMVAMKGMTVNFIYEEFHPDHKEEITMMTSRFFSDFFERKLNIDTYYLEDEQIQPNSTVISKHELIERFNMLYEVVDRFENTSFKIDKIDFELNKSDEESETRVGYSEGETTYELVFNSGGRKVIHGPFKIYFSRKWDCWGIYFFFLVGYNLNMESSDTSE
jgi:hypothetical protein